MYEAFDASYRFMTEFAAWVSLSLSVLAVLSPLVWGLAAALGRAAWFVSSLPARAGNRPVADAITLSTLELHTSLGRSGVGLAQDTRGLIESLAHARRARSVWTESRTPVEVRRGGWRAWIDAGRDAQYGPTIGATAEVWNWLASAEAYADTDAFAADQVAEIAAYVRTRLFAEGALRERLDEILGALVRLDGEWRISESSPYRGGPRRPTVTPACASRDDEDDEALVAARFARLEREHGGLLRSVAARYVRDPDRRRDLEQEIKIAVWRAIPAHRGEASLKTYAVRIAHYCASRFRRREPVFVGEGAPIELMPASGEDPETCLVMQRRRDRLRAAMAQLPEAQREALALQLQGVSYRDIAARLQISESNASVRITRARKALHRKLATA